MSLELIDELGVAQDVAVLDVGGGASRLVDHLVARGHVDVTVLDVSGVALEAVRDRLGTAASVAYAVADVRDWVATRRYGVWHDRAVFHFLTSEADRASYRATLDAALEPGGGVVLGTFAPEGPEQCSGLPVRRHSVADLADFLGADHTVVATRTEVHHTPWGAAQPFSWVAARRR